MLGPTQAPGCFLTLLCQPPALLLGNGPLHFFEDHVPICALRPVCKEIHNFFLDFSDAERYLDACSLFSE